MVVRRRKKVAKYRGYGTHGGGFRKKRRGAGSRGGRGRAGSGKRAGHKKFTFVNELGRVGFTSKRGFKIKALNVGYFTLEKVEKLVGAGKAVKEKNSYSINLAKLGYGKLLGAGKTNLKLKITVASYSSSAEEKIKSAGGEIISSGISSGKKSEEKSEEEVE